MVASRLEQLLVLSNKLGDPALDYVILGEGNTSSRIDEHSFWVKASGEELRSADGGSFVEVRFDKVLALLERDDVGDDDVRAGLEAAKADQSQEARASVETVLHAVALQPEGVESERRQAMAGGQLWTTA